MFKEPVQTGTLSPLMQAQKHSAFAGVDNVSNANVIAIIFNFILCLVFF